MHAGLGRQHVAVCDSVHHRTAAKSVRKERRGRMTENMQATGERALLSLSMRAERLVTGLNGNPLTFTKSKHYTV